MNWFPWDARRYFGCDWLPALISSYLVVLVEMSDTIAAYISQLHEFRRAKIERRLVAAHVQYVPHGGGRDGQRVSMGHKQDGAVLPLCLHPAAKTEGVSD